MYKLVSWISTSLVLATAILGGTAGAETDEALRKDLAVVQRPIADVTPPPSDIRVTAWVNHDDNIYQVGDDVTLFVRVNREAYVTIIDVGTSGKVHVIFPNRFQRNNRVRANQTIRIPGRNANFDFRVGGPPGIELIKVIATTSPDPIFDVRDLTDVGPFKAVAKSADAVAKDLEVVWRPDHFVDQSPNDARPDRRRPRYDWAVYDKLIRIVDPGAFRQ